jgi:hypothetical protein
MLQPVTSSRICSLSFNSSQILNGLSPGFDASYWIGESFLVPLTAAIFNSDFVAQTIFPSRPFPASGNFLFSAGFPPSLPGVTLRDPQSDSSGTVWSVVGPVLGVACVAGVSIGIFLFRRRETIVRTLTPRSEYSPDDGTEVATITVGSLQATVDLTRPNLTLFDATSVSDADDSLG